MAIFLKKRSKIKALITFPLKNEVQKSRKDVLSILTFWFFGISLKYKVLAITL